MSRIKEYYDGLTTEAKKVVSAVSNRKTLEDVEELIEKRLDDPPEHLTAEEIHQLEWVRNELETLKL